MPTKKRRTRPETGLTTSEAQFNRAVRKAARRIRRALSPIVKYNLCDKFRGEAEALASRLLGHAFKPRGEQYVGEPAEGA